LNTASPDQKEKYWNLRKQGDAIILVGLAWFIAVAWMLNFFPASIAVSALFLGSIGLIAGCTYWRFEYWKCPACGKPFLISRGHKKGECEHCGISFS
jgi:hypothetical protein